LNELKTLTKSNKILDKPKKPLTPYMLFVREVRNLLQPDVLNNSDYRQDQKW